MAAIVSSRPLPCSRLASLVSRLAFLVGAFLAVSHAPALSQFTTLAGADDGDLTVTASFTKAVEKKPAELTVAVEIPTGYHIYSTTQKKPLTATAIKTEVSKGFRLTGDFTADPAPRVHVDKDTYGDTPLEEHSGVVSWRVPIEFDTGVDTATLTIKGTVRAQRCTEKNCLPPKTFAFEAKLAVAAAPAPAKAPTEDRRPATKEFAPDSLHATVRGTIEPAVVKAGSVANLVLTAEPNDGYHFYALEDRDSRAIGVGKPTLIVMTDTAGLRYGRPQANASPTDLAGPDGTMHVHERPVQWTVPIEIPASAKPGEYAIAGLLGLQTCNDQHCDLPMGTEFSTKLIVGKASAVGAAKVDFRESQYSLVVQAADKRDGGGPIPKAPTTGSAGKTLPSAPSGIPPQLPMTLPMVLAFSLLGGLILNLMPCVLPVIGLKILSFVEQGGKSRGHVLALNIWYSLGLFSVFMVLASLAAFAGLAWGQHFQSLTFNVVLSSLVFVMALSFMGVWEIPIPGFIGSGKSVELAAREGAIGAFAKGVFTTVLATPCSGPFLGAVFGYTLNQSPQIIYLIFGCIGLGMASPYLLIGAFPELVRFLPKPGMWMETFKQLMGFVLLGTVVYLFTIIKPDYVVPTFALLMGLWAGCWWIGRTPITAEPSRKTLAWLVGGSVAAAVGVFAFTILTPGMAVLDWQPFSRAELARLTDERKTVLVDFTANWCPTCKWNLRFAIDTPEVRDVVESNRVVPVKADWTDYSDEITETLKTLHSQSIPVLAIFPAGQPNAPIVLRDTVSKQEVIDALNRAGPSHAGAAINQAADARGPALPPFDGVKPF